MNKLKRVFFFIISAFFLLSMSQTLQANVGGGWSCRAVVSQYCKNKAKCKIIFDQYGAMEVNFGKPVSLIKVGDTIMIHGQTHKISKVESLAPGFKLIEFKTIKTKK